MEPFTSMSFGGGLNSIAMCVGLVERQQPPSAIVFADTGGEKPETYDYILKFGLFLSQHGFPPITTVREHRWSLEQKCLDTGYLPSKAYGLSSCSDKFKIRPARRYLGSLEAVRNVWKAGMPVTQLIGFDLDEAHRMGRDRPSRRWVSAYPLVEWGMDREDCVTLIAKHGLPIPPKSSCFFCPSMKKKEIIDLRIKHPDLYERALRMERNAAANNQSVKGLGRSFSWADVESIKEDSQIELPCMCVDG